MPSPIAIARTLSLLVLLFTLPAPAQDVLTYHNNNARTGLNNKETILTPDQREHREFRQTLHPPRRRPCRRPTTLSLGRDHLRRSSQRSHRRHRAWHRLRLRRRHRCKSLAHHNIEIRRNHFRQSRMRPGQPRNRNHFDSRHLPAQDRQPGHLRRSHVEGQFRQLPSAPARSRCHHRRRTPQRSRRHLCKISWHRRQQFRTASSSSIPRNTKNAPACSSPEAPSISPGPRTATSAPTPDGSWAITPTLSPRPRSST